MSYPCNTKNNENDNSNSHGYSGLFRLQVAQEQRFDPFARLKADDSFDWFPVLEQD